MKGTFFHFHMKLHNLFSPCFSAMFSAESKKHSFALED
jgi:hypothetical protein